MRAFTRVLIAVDLTELASTTADVGFDVAVLADGECLLVHVIDPAGAVAPDSYTLPSDVLGEVRRDATALFDQLAATADQRGVTVATRIIEGSPADELLRVASDWAPDVLVVGAHRRGLVKRLLIGSTADTLIREASCPVLVVPQKD